MALIKITNGEQVPYSMGQLRRDNRRISFPKVVEASTLASYGVYSATVIAGPAYNAETEVPAQNAYATDVGGVWTYEWTVRSKTSDELAADVASVVASARGTRNALLAATDYTAMSDVTMSAGVRLYRQALRDVPTLPGFPKTHELPNKPEGL